MTFLRWMAISFIQTALFSLLAIAALAFFAFMPFFFRSLEGILLFGVVLLFVGAFFYEKYFS